MEYTTIHLEQLTKEELIHLVLYFIPSEKLQEYVIDKRNMLNKTLDCAICQTICKKLEWEVK